MSTTLGFGKHADTPIDELPTEYLYYGVVSWCSTTHWKFVLLLEELEARISDGSAGDYWASRYARWKATEGAKWRLEHIIN